MIQTGVETPGVDAITELSETVATSHTLHIRRSHTLPVVIRSMFILKSSFIKTPLIKLPSVGQDISLTLLAENPLNGQCRPVSN